MDANPAASPPAKAPADDPSASWNPALRPDSAHAPARHSHHGSDAMDSTMYIEDSQSSFDSPPPRTSEDRHPLNEDGPRFVFGEEDDEFAAWQDGNDDEDHGHVDAGARTPLADDRSQTPQPPALTAPPLESNDSAEDSLITPVEPPKSMHELPAEAASIAEPEPEPESTPVPAAPEPSPPPAEEPEPTPSIEHEQPDIEAIDTEALHETNPSAETPEEHSQEHNYEHQGETTGLEEAVQESAQVPLAEDTDSPALEWAASDGAFDKGSQQHEPLLEAQPDSGAVTENIEQAETEAEQAPALDFGDSGDGGFDLEGPMSAADAPLEVEEEKTRSQPTAAEDTASAANLDWGAAGEEDFSLEGPQQSAASGSDQPSEPARAEEKKTEETDAAGSLGWGNAAHADFDLGATAAPSQEPLAEAPKTETEPAAEASSAEAAPPTEQQAAAPDLDWGSTGDDDFGFGASAETSEALQPTQQQTEEPARAEEKDLSAMWAEALADDDLLEETSVDPSAFFLDDDDGFLDDSPPSTQNGATQANGAATAPATTNKYAPAVPQAPPAASKNPYAPQGLQTTNVAQLAQASAQTSPYGVYNQAYQQPQPPQRPSMPGSAQSFADKAKGGYASPFDLPEDLAKQPPRKKIVHAPTVPSPTTRGPPPRTPSMYSNPSSPALGPPANYGPSPTSAPSPNTPSGGFPGQPPSKAPSLTSKPSTGDFFEDLPVVPKPRPSGRYTPQVVKGPTPPPMSGPPSRQASQTYAPPVVPPPVGAQPQRPDSQPSQASQAYAAPAAPQRSSSYAPPAVQQLQQPERLNPFPDAPQQPQGLGVSSAPPAASRYSPAPPGVAAATSRYSPAPPSAPAASRYSPAPPPSVPSSAQNRYAVEPSAPPKPPALPFAPRTSSPLAYHSTPDHPVQRPSSSGSRRASLQPSVASGDDHFVSHSRASLEQVREVPDQGEKPATPPPPRSVPGSAVGSPARRTTANYTPQYQSIVSPPGQSGVAPPRRAQSQSPGATMKGPILSMAHIDRPASTNGVTSPTVPAPSHAPFAAAPPTSQPAAAGGVTQQRRRRTFSRDLSYVKPTDETVEDPLERWKGAPILRWGLGGTILTTFPKEIPRYGTGGVMPMVKCTPGEVKIQKAKELCPLWDPIAKFPGPLKTKSQKKQALTWLQQSIETMEQDYQSKIFNGELPGEVRIRFEEKILLWKVLEVFVEHDGQLEGSDTVNLAVKKVLLAGQVDEPQLSSPVDIMGASATTGSVNTAEPIDPQSVEQLRAHLLKGDREKAVWEAADKRLWGHSMLIASTMSKDIWKQVVQEFVRQEVRKVSGNNQSLAALYEVFAGNWEESIDELVPASARAGFQMVSKTDRSGANTNVFEGLDRWRETLMLIVNNRSEGDPQALVALGKLLAGYGRVEAAHICYLFARSAVVLSGADDPSAHVVLIGADHVNQRHELGRDIEPILLTEIYEFAISLSPPPAYAGLPHLQAFKLAHALTLAEYGYKTEAQAYCDAITTAMKSTTRLSPYYNASLVQELDDLVKRLSEAPRDSSSWISKPSMGKVSSSVWSSFNKFVAGDDDDADSTGPGGNDTSPFANVTGDTPSVSRSPSTVDMYGTYSGGAPLAPPSTIAGSRYAPSAGPYAPRTSGEQARSRYEPVGQSPYQPARISTESGERPDIPKDALFAHQGTPPSSYNPSPMQFSQQAKSQNAYAPTSGPMSAGSSPNPLGSPYTPTNAGFQSLGAPTNDQRSTSNYEPPTSSFGPPLGSQEGASNSYEPPASSYEPPSYQPYEPEPEAEEEEKPKKKAFMDDDDDDELERRAAALKAQQKAEADRIAEENFRKAAEADAQKASAPKKTGSWLGGWFKKSESNEQQGNKPIRAKLGEENSFYYDPDLKKWVNKKAGAQDQAKPAGTPPPPKGGPPPLRNTASMANLAGPPGASKLSPAAGTPPPPPNMRSTSMPPPMAASTPGSGAATPNRTDSPAPPTGGPPSAAGTPGVGAGPPQPPSRPATSMSNASSIDDLLGVPAPRKGGAPKKKGRSGRYVDVMAK